MHFQSDQRSMHVEKKTTDLTTDAFLIVLIAEHRLKELWARRQNSFMTFERLTANMKSKIGEIAIV